MCQLKPSVHTTTINHGPQLNSASFARLRRRPTDIRVEGMSPVYLNQKFTDKEIKAAKRCYSRELEDSFSANNPSSKWRELEDILLETEDQEGIRPTQCDPILSKSLCRPADTHLYPDFQQITGAVCSPVILQTLHNISLKFLPSQE